MKPEISLKVAEAQQDDVNKGIVRIDSQLMKKINVQQGEIVEIEGEKKKSVGIAGRAFPADMGLEVIRLDSFTRRNAGTSIGEKVNIRKADVKHAKQVTIAPVGARIMISGGQETFKRSLLGRAVMKGDIISLGGTRRRRQTMKMDSFDDIFRMAFGEGMGMEGGTFGFGGLKFQVANTNPKEAVIITEDTNLDIKHEPVEVREEAVPEVAYEDIGGLEEEVKKVREMIELPLKHPEIFQRLGIKPPKGVLLHGPPGTGKTLLAKAVASETQAHFIHLDAPTVMNKFVGEAEKRLRDIFDQAEKNAPSIIFIDELDSIAPKREESYGEVERRVVAQLLALMDGLKGRGKVIVIAATNRPDALDPALRRGGRFDREIEIGIPNKAGRLDILKIHTRNMPLNKNVNIKELAEVTHGFVGADLEALCKEAAMSVLRRNIPSFKFKDVEKIPEEFLQKLQVKKNDFKEALKIVRPSAMREVLVETPKVPWTSIGGLEKAKQELKEAVEWPLKNPEDFKRMGIRPPRGVLLYGPPGTGKTLLARAVATESKANFISVKGPEVFSKWVGESEKAIRKIFAKARQVSPAIIFFDEIDAIASGRGAMDSSRTNEKVVNQILSEMDGLEELADVVVLAATNRPELIDSALLRPGRFDRQILILPPDARARLEIFNIHLGINKKDGEGDKVPLARDVNIPDLVKKTEGFSGADIEGLVREAAMRALREKMDCKEVKKKHFEEALGELKPSLAKHELDKYEKVMKTVKAGAAVPEYMG
jgi:transitional endoplasmic reticulum ATPase